MAEVAASMPGTGSRASRAPSRRGRALRAHRSVGVGIHRRLAGAVDAGEARPVPLALRVVGTAAPTDAPRELGPVHAVLRFGAIGGLVAADRAERWVALFGKAETAIGALRFRVAARPT